MKAAIVATPSYFDCTKAALPDALQSLDCVQFRMDETAPYMHGSSATWQCAKVRV